MRIIVDLDDDVAAAVKELQTDRGLGLSAALNEIARRGLAVPQQRQEFVQRTTSGELLVDVRKIGEVLAMLDEDESRS